MYPAVVKAVPNEDFTLAIVFDNGEQGVLDMKPYLDVGAFQRISDPDQFKRVRIVFDTVQWDCGVDLDPEFIYGKWKSMSRIRKYERC